jgi:hypothetical protein
MAGTKGAVVRGTKDNYEVVNGTAGYVLTSNGVGSAPSFQAASGGGGGGEAWIPLSLGVEPLTFVSDGAGNPILVAYTP